MSVLLCKVADVLQILWGDFYPLLYKPPITWNISERRIQVLNETPVRLLVRKIVSLLITGFAWVGSTLVYIYGMENPTKTTTQLFTNQTLFPLDVALHSRRMLLLYIFAPLAGFIFALQIWFAFFEEMVEGSNQLILLSRQLTARKTMPSFMFESGLKSFKRPDILQSVKTQDYFSHSIVNKPDLIGLTLIGAITGSYLITLSSSAIVVFLDIDPILQYVIVINKQFPSVDNLLGTVLESLGNNTFLKVVFMVFRFVCKVLIWFELLRLLMIWAIPCISALQLCTRNAHLVEKISQNVDAIGTQRRLQQIRAHRQLWLCANVLKEHLGAFIFFAVLGASIVATCLNYGVVRWSHHLPVFVFVAMVYHSILFVGIVMFLLSQSVEFNEGMSNSKRSICLGTAILKGREGNILRREVKSLFPGMLEIRFPIVGRERLGHDARIAFVRTIVNWTFNALLTF